jgi:hypothetical protein
MRSSRLTLAAVLALGAFASAGSAASVASPAVNARPPAPSRSTAQHVGSVGHARGPGWSHAQVQRMGRKRKNQRRMAKKHRGYSPHGNARKVG